MSALLGALGSVQRLTMGNPSGHEVARALRMDPALRSGFQVTLTGHALPHDRRRAVKADSNSTLPNRRVPRLDELISRVTPKATSDADE